MEFSTEYDPGQLADTAPNIQLETPQPKPKSKPKPKPQPQSSLANMGLSDFKSQPDLFGSQPAQGPELGNHVVEDPEFSPQPTRAKAKTKPSSSAGDVSDVVANPFIGGQNQQSSGNRAREMALKRKKENELLAAYQTDDSASTSGPKTYGINRLGLWLGSVVLNIVTSVAVTAMLFTLDIEPPDPSNPNSKEFGMSLLMVYLVAVLIVGVGNTVLVSMRIQNIRFKNTYWETLATYSTAGMYGSGVVSIGLSMLALGLEIGWLGLVAIPVVLVGAICSLPAMVFAIGALLLPPDYGIHKKLDNWTWINLGVFLGLPLLMMLFFVVLSIVAGVAGSF